jgi:arginine-tRNA-protein transferase
LAQIHRAHELGLSYVYLGYWIKQCDKMNYKTDYRPLELLINRRWLRLN